MKKYVVMFILVMGVSCIKIPKDQPIWWVTLRVPIGDSCVTVYDVIQENPEDYEIIYDSIWNPDTLFQDSIVAMLQSKIVEYSDTDTIKAPPWQQLFYVCFRRSMPKEIDTLSSQFGSILFTMLGKVRFKGEIYDTVTGFIRFTPWYWEESDSSFHIWTQTGETLLTFTFYPGHIDTILKTVYDSFPFGPHKLEIRPNITSGKALFDTVAGYKSAYMGAVLLEDIIFTVEDTFETTKEIRKAAEKGQIARARIVLNIKHSLPAEAYGTIYLKGLEWPPDSIIDEFPFYAAPKDTITGRSIADTAWADTIEVSQHHFNVFQDSLVFYWVKVHVPPQGNAYLRPSDSLRVSGWVEVTVLTDLEALEEK